MSAHRDRCINFVLEHEGGYSNDPNDPGGETKFGISSRSYPDLDIERLTRIHAEAIYRTDFWEKLNLPRLPPIVSATMLDVAVNCGPGRATRWLQEAINNLLQSPTNSTIPVDGDLGEMTVKAASHCEAMPLALAVCSMRLKHYCSISQRKTKYLRGWVYRVAALQDLLIKEVYRP